MLLKIAGEMRVKLCSGNTWIDTIGYSPISLQLLNGFDSQEYSATVFTNTHYVENLEVKRICKCKFNYYLSYLTTKIFKIDVN